MQNSYLVGLIGTGVGPSLTPAMHMGEGRSQGLDYVYRTIDLNTLGISPDRIGEVLSWARDLGFDAVNVTHPCKQLALAHLDDIDPVAATLGAVNTVLFSQGPLERLVGAGDLTALPDEIQAHLRARATDAGDAGR